MVSEKRRLISRAIGDPRSEGIRRSLKGAREGDYRELSLGLAPIIVDQIFTSLRTVGLGFLLGPRINAAGRSIDHDGIYAEPDERWKEGQERYASHHHHQFRWIAHHRHRADR